MVYHMFERAVIEKAVRKKNGGCAGERTENLGYNMSSSGVYCANMIVRKGKIQPIEGKVGICKRTIGITRLKA